MKKITLKRNAAFGVACIAGAYCALGFQVLGVFSASVSGVVAGFLLFAGVTALFLFVVFPVLVTQFIGRHVGDPRSLGEQVFAYAPWAKYFVVEKDGIDE